MFYVFNWYTFRNIDKSLYNRKLLKNDKVYGWSVRISLTNHPFKFYFSGKLYIRPGVVLFCFRLPPPNILKSYIIEIP